MNIHLHGHFTRRRGLCLVPLAAGRSPRQFAAFTSAWPKSLGVSSIKADFDLIVAGIEASSINVDNIVAELSKIAAVKSVRPLVHHVTGYQCETFAMGEIVVRADGWTGKSEEHTCYDMYFFPTQSVQDKKLLITKGKGNNRGKVTTDNQTEILKKFLSLNYRSFLSLKFW